MTVPDLVREIRLAATFDDALLAASVWLRTARVQPMTEDIAATPSAAEPLSANGPMDRQVLSEAEERAIRQRHQDAATYDEHGAKDPATHTVRSVFADYVQAVYDRARLLATLDKVREDDLGAAWQAAEAALPDGWWLHTLHAWSFDDMAYRAEAVAAGHTDYLSTSERDKIFGARRYVSGPSIDAYGPTPAAALQALTFALSSKPERSET